MTIMTYEPYELISKYNSATRKKVNQLGPNKTIFYYSIYNTK